MAQIASQIEKIAPQIDFLLLRLEELLLRLVQLLLRLKKLLLRLLFCSSDWKNRFSDCFFAPQIEKIASQIGRILF